MKYVNETGGSTMIVDIGARAPLLIISKKGMKRYIDGKKANEKDKKYTEYERRFKFGENVYVSNKNVTFTIIIKGDDGDNIR